jgi:predicted tellurium resistance membrane protein TerC
MPKGAIRSRNLKARQHNKAFLVLFLSVIVLSGLQITASDYPFGVFKLFLSFFFWLLCCQGLQITKEKGQEKFKDAKGAIRNRNMKARQHNNQKKKNKKSWKMPKGLSEAVI